MKQIFAFLLLILFISLSQELNLKSKDGCDYSRPHYGGCKVPYFFGCVDGVWGCHLRSGFKKVMKTKDGCDYSRPHHGGCAKPLHFGCVDGKWGCYPRSSSKKIN